MTEYLVGGRRRIDRVLAPAFLGDLAELDLDSIRSRRADAEQEEIDLSFARRMLQGRLDLLRAEQAGRGSGDAVAPGVRTDAELAAGLARVLADPGPRRVHGSGKHVSSLLPSRLGEHRREAERAVADVTASDSAALSDDELDATVSNLTDVERRLSAARRQVQAVVDTLTEEIARRYAAGDARVTLP